MSSPYLGISDFLQSPSMRCLGAHPMWKVSHKREIETHPWTQSSDANKWGSQDALPAECEVSRIQDPE